MKHVRIDKAKLVKLLTTNRDEHRQIFLDAQVKYREVAIAALDLQLKRAREGNPFNLVTLTHIIAPQDHTQDYERVLRMLALSEDTVITLDESEFAQYVDDNWGWSRSWARSNSTYTASTKFDALLRED